MSEMKQVLVAVTSLATISLLTVLTFQNCSKVGFQNNDELSLAGIDGEMRSVFLNPEAKEDRPNINITAILDNSPSMQPIQDQVAQALSAVSSKVRGFDGKVEIYTTTQDSAGDSAKKPSYKVSEEIVYSDNNGTEMKLPLDQEDSVPDALDYEKRKNYELSSSFTPGGQPLSYSGSMDDSSFEAFQQSMSDAISNIGVSGSLKEQGLCTLLRAAEAKQQSSDFEVFLVAGNAEDETDAAGCLQQSSRQYTKSVNDPELVSCDSSDPDCKFRYKVTYDKLKKEKLSYKYLHIDRDVSYSLNQTTGSYKIKYWYDRHGLEYKYRKKTFTRTIYYKRYVDLDGLKVEDTTEHNKRVDNNQVGLCPDGVKTKESVSCSSIEGMLSGPEKAEGLQAGTCSISCSEGQTSSDEKRGIHSYQAGLCSDHGHTKGRETCTTSEKNTLASQLGIDANEISSCDINCYQNADKYGDKTISSCEGGADQDPCNGSQENRAVDDAPSYITNKTQLNKCELSCVENNVTGELRNFPSSSLSSCEGQSASDEDKWNYPSCTDEMKDEILDKHSLSGYGDIKDCSYKCEHDHQDGGIDNYVNPSSCTPGVTSCTGPELLAAEADLADDHGRPASRMVAGSCKNSCVDGNSKNACTQTMDADNLCSGSTPTGALASACDGGGFTYKSCTLETSFKDSSEVTYSTTEGSWQNQSYIGGGESFEDKVASQLSSSFGNSFYLASFNVPTNDDSCKPDGPNIDPAARFEALHQKIGSDRGQFFPKCLPDYSDSLNFVLDLVVNYVEKTYIVDLNPENEFIYRVTFYYKDGSIKRLDKSLYSANNKILAFDESVDLEPVERIHVEVVTERKKD